MKEYYTAVVILTVSAMLIVQTSVHYNATLDKERRQVTQALFLIIALTSLCEWGGVMLNGGEPRLIPLHWFVKMVELSLTPCIGLVCSRSLMKTNWVDRVSEKLVLFHAVLVVFSVFTREIFFVDAQNVYHHGPMYGIYLAACIGTVGLFFVRGTQTFKRYQHSGGVLIWLITLFLVTGIVVQEIDSELRITWLTAGISSILFYKVYGDVFQQVDGLTELINRWGYENYLCHFRGQGAIIFLDVDRFKEINDTYGHAMGDLCLTTVAECIRQALGPYGKCFRIGGDEFCVILEKRQGDVVHLLEQLSKKMAEARKEQPCLPGLSAGYVVFDTASRNINDAIQEADEQMYEAKRRNHAEQDLRRTAPARADSLRE